MDSTDVAGTPVSVGDRLSVASRSGGDDCERSGMGRCTVRYVGCVPPTTGLWLGVEWDDPERGKHDGSHEGVRYFDTRPLSTAGSFIRPKKADPGVSLFRAVQTRYGLVSGDTESTGGVEQQVIDEIQREINAPFFEVVGFDAVNRKQSRFDRLRTLGLGGCRVRGSPPDDDLATLIGQVAQLDLAANLLPSWASVAAVGRQLPRLTVLTVDDNRLALPPPSPPHGRGCLADAFRSLRQLNMAHMGYGWNDVLAIAAAVPTLEVLKVDSNAITTIPTMPSYEAQCTFPNLLELSLAQNQLGNVARLEETNCSGSSNNNSLEGGSSGWMQVMNLSHLPKLRLLNVSGCGITGISISSRPPPPFPLLIFLQLSDNRVSSWSDVSALDALPRLTELRLRANPVLESDSGETCRQVIIASIARLKMLNGTEIFKAERYGAELDYLKKYGKEYLDIQKELMATKGGNQEAAQQEGTTPPSTFNSAESFSIAHPRYTELVALHGAPEEAEVRAKDTSIKGSLLTVRIIAAPGASASVAFAAREKSLPPSMSVQKLRSLLARMCRVKPHALTLSYVSSARGDDGRAQDTTLEVPLDNDLREISFYSIANGDTIYVRW